MFPWPETFSTISNSCFCTEDPICRRKKKKESTLQTNTGLKIEVMVVQISKGVGSIRCGCSLISVKNLLVPGF
jgi:hypothetical protein